MISWRLFIPSKKQQLTKTRKNYKSRKLSSSRPLLISWSHMFRHRAVNEAKEYLNKRRSYGTNYHFYTKSLMNHLVFCFNHLVCLFSLSLVYYICVLCRMYSITVWQQSIYPPNKLCSKMAYPEGNLGVNLQISPAEHIWRDSA